MRQTGNISLLGEQGAQQTVGKQLRRKRLLGGQGVESE
jgi:hypothetical protein